MEGFLASFIGGAIGMSITGSWFVAILFGIGFACIVEGLLESKE